MCLAVISNLQNSFANTTLLSDMYAVRARVDRLALNMLTGIVSDKSTFTLRALSIDYDLTGVRDRKLSRERSSHPWIFLV